MSDRSRSDADAMDAERPEFVIPDGGLGTSMPEWLLQRPDWALAPTVLDADVDVTVAEEPAVVAELSSPGDDILESPVRELPPPDTTPIQLADVLTVDDLPDWLRAIAARSEQDRQADDSGTDSEPATTDVDAVVPDGSVATAESALVSPESGVSTVAAEEEASSRPVWLSDKVVGGLIAAAVLIALYVVLTLTNVI